MRGGFAATDADDSVDLDPHCAARAGVGRRLYGDRGAA